ncbi:hypothetical protein H0H93_007071 [Arthromyces matolae]|nr:hypothetical protein H0H93_007071 [Arthromyces matolae]
MKQSTISQGLAVSFIGAVFLAYASPIASNPHTVVQRNVIASENFISSNPRGIYSIPELAVDVKLSDSNGLTRRNGHASPAPDLTIMNKRRGRHLPPGSAHITPIVFFDFLQRRHSLGRGQQLELWGEDRVNDLEAKVDRLDALGFPTWLIKECWEQIDFETQLIQLFRLEEDEDSEEYAVIKEHEADIEHVKGKLSVHAPKLGAPPPNKYLPKKPALICDESNHHIESVHGRPSRTLSPSPSNKLEDNPPQLLSSSTIERHIKARRDRIEQWAQDGVGPSKRQLKILKDSGFPNWLEDDFTYQISHALALITLFEQEETKYLGTVTTEQHDAKKYLDIMKKHRLALAEVEESLKEAHKTFIDLQLVFLLPKMGEGRDWMRVVKYFVKEVKTLHLYDHRGTRYDQIEAGLKVYEEMARPDLITRDQNLQFVAFRAFLCDQEIKLKKAKDEFQAGQHGHNPTITKSR